MVKRILIYGFPFYLVFIEFMLRRAVRSDKELEFMGPTLAAVAVSLLLPLIVPKRRDYSISQDTKKDLASKGITIMYESESRFIDIVWGLIFVLTASWAYSLYLSWQPEITAWWHFPSPLSIGLISYFIAVLLSEVKEAV